MRLPRTHTWTSYDSGDAGGPYREWWAEHENGDDPLHQRWYAGRSGSLADAPTEPPDPRGWSRPNYERGPDRTDPGYWLDNF